MIDLCRYCQQPIAIPGLDASLCPRCGWIENRSVEEIVDSAPRKKRRAA